MLVIETVRAVNSQPVRIGELIDGSACLARGGRIVSDYGSVAAGGQHVRQIRQMSINIGQSTQSSATSSPAVQPSDSTGE
jgi:hypothetical protein